MVFIPGVDDYDPRALFAEQQNPLGIGGPPQRQLPPALRPTGMLPEREGIPRTMQYMQQPPAAAAPAPAAASSGPFGMSRDTLGTVGQTMIGLASGLLSRGYGESGAQALGRGLQNASQAALQSGREQRKRRARERLKELAADESIPPIDRESYSILAEMASPEQGLVAMIQSRGADRRATQASSAAEARAIRSHERSMERSEAAFERTQSLPYNQQKHLVYTIQQAKAGNPSARKALRLSEEGTDIPDNLQMVVDEWMRMDTIEAIRRGATVGVAYPGAAPSQFRDPTVD
jgi:hypothetical protein